jgi:hypothetical protein
MSNLAEQKKLEAKMAEDGAKQKGFMKDLGWFLLGYTILFSVFGFLSFKASPLWSILCFASAFILDVVCIVSYIQYPKSKYESDPNHMT